MLNTPVKDFFTEAAGGFSLSEKSTADNSSADNTGTNTTDNTDNSDNTDNNNSDETDDGGEAEYTFDDIDMETSLVYYVSADGNDAASGEKDTPFQTIDKALSTLKASFTAEKTSGYVLLLSDINITREIKLETFMFAELDPIVANITIAGYGTRRTIDANSNCRVMSIGYTKGNIYIKNLILAEGYNLNDDGDEDGVGGSGLYISSVDCSGKKCLIENCIIKDNMSTKSGAALALNTDYEVDITNSVITNNLCWDGASVCDLTFKSANPGLVISDTSITENNTSIMDSSISFDFGYVINTTGMTFAKLAGGVTIKNNEINSVPSVSDYSKLCAVYNTAGLEITGANVISNNLVYLNGASEGFTRNIVLSTASSSATATMPPIYVTGNCVGSSIGVSIASTITSAVSFTSGYSTSGTSVVPGTIFISDCSYGIGYNSDSTEAAFVLNSGSFSNPFDYTVSFAVSPDSMVTGQETTFTVTPVVKKNGVLVSSSELTDITWSLSLSNGSSIVAVSTSDSITVDADNAFPDTYTLNILFVLNGFGYDDTISIVCQ